ncbi:hypothetical protein GCM10007362_31780 [Saccharibacillus endophyticus]|uniref:Uncharacterized protein n=1 Tax=Saccharibacillus endophyticus TaxID=2060666 RepID=A0ABQ1ZX86_9BACL|nr:hypothetical protein GCM10007362_31780 [Saccharibacillus endophyticus]
MWERLFAWIGIAPHPTPNPGNRFDVAARPKPENNKYFGSARLGSARLGSARLGSARLGSARLGSANGLYIL